jgi:protein PhnA
MNTLQALQERSTSTCELCADSTALDVHVVSPKDGKDATECILACAVCREGLASEGPLDVNHWRCLTTSMWSEVPAVQVVAFRLLTQLADEAWARENLEMLYLEDEVRAWAETGLETPSNEPAVVHKDANGAVLEAGDTVTLIKDLNVKGGGFTAKRGTAVRGIRLVHDNPEHIEGRISGQEIVILTEFVKKAK